jgi:glycosyltransferase involved in cell wall biosynthesis
LAADYVLVTNHDTLEMAKAVKNTDSAKIIFVPDTAVPKVMEMLEPIVRPIENKLKLLWVGRMLPRKGLNLILEALAHVPPDVDYSLTIVGGGEQFHLIDQWVNKFGIDKSKLIVLGQIPFIEVIEHYKKADAFIFCSLRDSFAAQLTEAMAFGLPIIALNIHGVTIGVPDNCGIKITPVTKEGTLKDIAAAITTMHSNPAFRQQCSDNAFNYSKTNTWHNRVNTVIEKYY